MVQGMEGSVRATWRSLRQHRPRRCCDRWAGHRLDRRQSRLGRHRHHGRPARHRGRRGRRHLRPSTLAVGAARRPADATSSSSPRAGIRLSLRPWPSPRSGLRGVPDRPSGPTEYEDLRRSPPAGDAPLSRRPARSVVSVRAAAAASRPGSARRHRGRWRLVGRSWRREGRPRGCTTCCLGRSSASRRRW